jgi:hypothetical protein
VLFAGLVAASFLKPSAAGHGTHEQLGLPPCTMLAVTGHPCPTCGMTTALAAMAHAQWLPAWRAQPFGAALALAAAALVWGCLHVALFGSGLARLGAKLLAPRILWIAAAAWAAAWIWKIATWQ